MSTQERLPQFDLLRSLAIIGVVVIHTTAPVLASVNGTRIPLSVSQVVIGTINLLARFCVPAFFVLSGFFSTYRHKNLNHHQQGSWRYDWRYVVQRSKRLFLPYLFWSLVIYLPTEIINSDRNIPGILLNFLFGNTFLGGYFLIALIQLTALEPVFLFLLVNKNKSYAALGVLSFLCSLAYLTADIYCSFAVTSWTIDLVVFYSMASFPVWAFYYLLGLYWGYRPDKLLNIKKVVLKTIGWASLFFIAASTGLFFVFYQQLGNSLISTSFFVPTTIGYSIGLITIVSNIKITSETLVARIKIISTSSLAIYLINGWLLSQIMKYQLDFNRLIVQVVLIFLAIFLPLAFYQISLRYFHPFVHMILFGEPNRRLAIG